MIWRKEKTSVKNINTQARMYDSDEMIQTPEHLLGEQLDGIMGRYSQWPLDFSQVLGCIIWVDLAARERESYGFKKPSILWKANLFWIYSFLCCVYECFAYTYVYALGTCSALGGWKRLFHLPELALQMVVSPYVGSVNLTQVLWKNS